MKNCQKQTKMQDISVMELNKVLYDNTMNISVWDIWISTITHTPVTESYGLEADQSSNILQGILFIQSIFQCFCRLRVKLSQESDEKWERWHIPSISHQPALSDLYWFLIKSILNLIQQERNFQIFWQTISLLNLEAFNILMNSKLNDCLLFSLSLTVINCFD